MNRKIDGFTIVELLIVIVVIGILAAISIVAYRGINNRAYDSTVQSDLKGLAKAYEAYRIQNVNDTYPLTALMSGTSNPDFTYPVSKDAYKLEGNTYNLLNCRSDAGQGYTVIAQSKSGKYYSISNQNSNASEVKAGISLATTSACSAVALGSSPQGAGYGNAWRVWTNG